MESEIQGFESSSIPKLKELRVCLTRVDASSSIQGSLPTTLIPKSKEAKVCVDHNDLPSPIQCSQSSPLVPKLKEVKVCLTRVRLTTLESKMPPEKT